MDLFIISMNDILAAYADVPVAILFLSTKELRLKKNHVVSEVATGVKTSCAILSRKIM